MSEKFHQHAGSNAIGFNKCFKEHFSSPSVHIEQCAGLHLTQLPLEKKKKTYNLGITV